MKKEKKGINLSKQKTSSSNDDQIMQETSETTLSKSELFKARVDEGKSLMDKIRSRQDRNDRQVLETRTPTGQNTRTSRSHRRRVGELESGLTSIFDKPDDNGSPQRVRMVPEPRRRGEKIVGTPRTMEEGGRHPNQPSAEREYGVHMHSGTMAGKNLPVGGGPKSAAPVSARGDIKTYAVGNRNDAYGSRQRHQDVMAGMDDIKPDLPKSEESQTKAIPETQKPKINISLHTAAVPDDKPKTINKPVSAQPTEGKPSMIKDDITPEQAQAIPAQEEPSLEAELADLSSEEKAELIAFLAQLRARKQAEEQDQQETLPPEGNSQGQKLPQEQPMAMSKSEFSPAEVALEILKKAESMYKAKTQEWDDQKPKEAVKDTDLNNTREVVNENDINEAAKVKLAETSAKRLENFLVNRKKAKK